MVQRFPDLHMIGQALRRKGGDRRRHRRPPFHASQPGLADRVLHGGVPTDLHLDPEERMSPATEHRRAASSAVGASSGSRITRVPFSSDAGRLETRRGARPPRRPRLPRPPRRGRAHPRDPRRRFDRRGPSAHAPTPASLLGCCRSERSWWTSTAPCACTTSGSICLARFGTDASRDGRARRDRPCVRGRSDRVARRPRGRGRDAPRGRRRADRVRAWRTVRSTPRSLRSQPGPRTRGSRSRSSRTASGLHVEPLLAAAGLDHLPVITKRPGIEGRSRSSRPIRRASGAGPARSRRSSERASRTEPLRSSATA